MSHLDLLHRARTALQYPWAIDKEALIRDLNEAIRNAYPPKRPKKQCYCGEINCNAHTDMEVGEG